MHIRDFSHINRQRCESSQGFDHPLGQWALSEWLVATLGELGEAANIAKKLNRIRDGIPGNSETETELLAALQDELADAFTYLDLTAQSCGFNTEGIVLSKWD